MVRDGGDFIEQRGQHGFGGRRLRGLEHRQHPCANLRRNRLQRRDEVGQKAGRVVIPCVQRQPGHGPAATGDPGADQRGFAKAGGGRDEGQLAVQPRVEPLEQAGNGGRLAAAVGGYRVWLLEWYSPWLHYIPRPQLHAAPQPCGPAEKSGGSQERRGIDTIRAITIMETMAYTCMPVVEI